MARALRAQVKKGTRLGSRDGCDSMRDWKLDDENGSRTLVTSRGTPQKRQSVFWSLGREFWCGKRGREGKKQLWNKSAGSAERSEAIDSGTNNQQGELKSGLVG